jgi:transposase
MANNKRWKTPADYSPDACAIVVALMATGLSLTAAAGAMGVSRTTIDAWIKQHDEFREAVSRGRAARVLAHESQMFASENAAVVSARRFSLLNAAPDEWREKQIVDPDTSEDTPIRQLAKQLMGTAIRPKMPKKTIQHEPVAPSEPEPQQSVPIDDEDDCEVRIHTVSREAYYEDDKGAE